MALAFLFSSLSRTYRFMKLVDNPFDHAHCLVVDHQLRENSTEEALLVSQQLRKLGLKASTVAMRWKEEKKRGLHPPDLPNLETLARRYRYRLLGSNCSYVGAKSLFFAHHRDDQYETILMRLLSGHGYRGLQGIRESNEIPECYDLHRVYKSGLLDDQRSPNPYLSFKPPNREMKRLRWVYKREGNRALGETPMQTGPLEFAERRALELEHDVPYMTPLSSEDGGVTIFRPLLAFDKDRLIATCEANNVAWFEDATNQVPTLTTRNAIRYLVKHHELPKALQKPSILGLCQRARRKMKNEENEAQRLFARESVIEDFDSNVGTLLVRLPELSAKIASHRTLWAGAREKVRMRFRRKIAAVLARKLIEYVTPEDSLPPLTHLENVVDRLFPQLSREPQLSAPAKAFSIAGVWFSPVSEQRSTRWFLSRAPYSASQPLPKRALPKSQISAESTAVEWPEQTPRHVAWRGWGSFKLWDGRFWVLINSCVHASFHLYPLYPEHLKAFRKALPLQERIRLERLLKYHAPGKIRYTLPALYSVEAWRNKDEPQAMTLLALPSLGIHLPGMDRWVRYEIRYRHVDLKLLGRQRRGRHMLTLMYQPSRSKSRRLRGLRLTGTRSKQDVPEDTKHIEQASE